MYLFLAALGMLFGSSMVGYAVIRFTQSRPKFNPVDNVEIPAHAPALGQVHMPVALWFSTLAILASSVTIHLALQNVRRERQHQFRTCLMVTLALSILFLLIQIPSLATLLFEHFGPETGHAMFGLVFFLILVHALHVVGGVGPLWVVTYRAGQGRYDHESYAGVKYVAMYWHFLDGVWLFMFGVLLALR